MQVCLFWRCLSNQFPLYLVSIVEPIAWIVHKSRRYWWNSGWDMYITADRRVKPRIACEYQAVVEGMNGEGKRYQNQAVLTNLSSCGLFLITNRQIAIGSRISVTIQLANSTINPDAPKLVINGIVIRTEPRGEGTCGVAVKFSNYRFL